METRPKIKLTLSPLDYKLELAGKTGLVIIWALAVFTFLKLPATIPTHFNFRGQADGYGNKIILLILPALGTAIYLGLAQLGRYPHIFNYIKKITEDNAENQYTMATRMLRFLRLAILLIFSFIILFTYLVTTGVSKGLGYWLLPLTLVLILLPVIYWLVKSLKKEHA